MPPPLPRMYTDLAPWFHILTAPEDYADEAKAFRAMFAPLFRDAGRPTLLELGSGGGNNASHLKQWFDCTLSDLSGEMLALSRQLNPELPHIEGDMRTLRLGRTFDAVFVHDAVEYMTTPADLKAAMGTARAHLRRGGMAVFAPDTTREIFYATTDHGGHDGTGGRAMRYLEWTHEADPVGTTYTVDYAYLFVEPGREPVVVHDRHVLGIFSREEWLAWLREAGFEPAMVTMPDPEDGRDVFVATAV